MSVEVEEQEREASSLLDDPLSYGSTVVGNVIYHTGPYASSHLEKMLRDIRKDLSKHRSLIDQYRAALGEAPFELPESVEKGADSPSYEGDSDDEFVSDNDGGEFVSDAGEAPPPSDADLAGSHSEIWAEYQALDRELEYLKSELNDLRVRYQAKVDAGEIDDTVRDPGRASYLAARSDASGFDPDDDFGHLLGRFDDAPVKDARTVRPPAPKQMSLFSEKAEVAAALPKGVGLGSSGYGGIYK